MAKSSQLSAHKDPLNLCIKWVDMSLAKRADVVSSQLA